MSVLSRATDAMRLRMAEAIGHLSASVRVLPDFLILGAQRAGTASLYYTLTRHPCVVAAVRKEVNFFDFGYWRGPEWYRGFFPTRAAMASLRRDRGAAVTGEATPYYLFHPASPARVKTVAPDARLIVLLRNPVDRAYSHFQREVAKRREPLAFAEALAREAERLRGEEERLRTDARYHSLAHQRFSYRARGIYVVQLRAWMREFPRERFLILESEALFADPAPVLAEVTAFLNLPAWQPGTIGRHNQMRYTALDPTVRTDLEAFYTPYNAQLEALLGRTFSWGPR